MDPIPQKPTVDIALPSEGFPRFTLVSAGDHGAVIHLSISVLFKSEASAPANLANLVALENKASSASCFAIKIRVRHSQQFAFRSSTWFNALTLIVDPGAIV
jgi:hypothetical protein